MALQACSAAGQSAGLVLSAYVTLEELTYV
jgi:hypothetical protein